MAARLKPLTEAAFTAQVLALAKLRGWRALHVRPARTVRGWHTPVQGDGKGFPDLLLVRGGRILVAELKVGRRRPTPEQWRWLLDFEAAGVPAYCWHPGDWPEIERVLEG